MTLDIVFIYLFLVGVLIFILYLLVVYLGLFDKAGLAFHFAGLLMVCISLALILASLSASHLVMRMPTSDNYSLRLLPKTMRIADKISLSHIQYFASPVQAGRLIGCKDEVSALLKEYTVGAMSDFLDCKPKLDFDPQSPDEITKLKAMYR